MSSTSLAVPRRATSRGAATSDDLVAKTLAIFGYGPGISHAVARRFAREGFKVALVARNAEKLAAGVETLRAADVQAKAFPTDMSDPLAIEPLITRMRTELGAIAAIHWNAPAGGAGDLIADDPLALRAAFDVSVTSLVAAVQSALGDLREAHGSVLVTNGAVALVDPKLDDAAVEHGFMGGAIAKTAQHKTVGLLARKLRPEGVFVGEVVVAGIVKGTGYDTGNGLLTSDEVAERFWKLHCERPENAVALLGVGLSGRGRP